MPQRCGDGEAGVGSGGDAGWDGVEIPTTIATKNHTTGLKILDRKKPKSSNSIEQRLSRVNCLTDKRLCKKEGTMRTLVKSNFDAGVRRVE